MTNPTSNFGWQMPTSTDLVTDLPADFEVFGQAVDTSLADLKGGTSGQILAKATNADMDFTWITNDVGDITAVTAGTGISGGGTSGAVTITNSMATEIAAKGDLIVGTGSQTFDNLGVGTNGQLLQADSTTATGLKWTTPATASSGLTWLAGGSFSAVSSVALANNIISDTYLFYKLFINITADSAGGNLLLRQRQGGSDYTANYYAGGEVTDFNNVSVFAQTNNASAWNLRGCGDRIAFSIDLMGWRTSKPKFSASGSISGTAQGGAYMGGFCLGSGTPDSLSFSASTGTITGTYGFYGFSNS